MYNGSDNTERGDNLTSIYVADACVIVKWLLPGEPYEQNADVLKEHIRSGKADMSSSAFMTQEVANALWDAIGRGRITRNAQETLKSSKDLQIDLHEFNWTESSDELAIAYQLDLTICDVAYLLLSKKMNTQVITAGYKMCNKAKGKFSVLHLKDYV